MQRHLLILEAGILGFAVVAAALVFLFVVDRLIIAYRRRRGTRNQISQQHEHGQFVGYRSIPGGSQQLHVTVRAKTRDHVPVRVVVAVQYRLQMRSRARVFYDPSRAATQITTFYQDGLARDIAATCFAQLSARLVRVIEAIQADFARMGRLRGLEIQGAYVAFWEPMASPSAAERSSRSSSGLRVKAIGSSGSPEPHSSPKH